MVDLDQAAAEGEVDLLMTNEDERSHAETGKPFLDFADVLLAAQLPGQKLKTLGLLARAIARQSLPVPQALRGIGIIFKATARPVRSLATELYTGSPVQLGELALRYALRPHPSTLAGSRPNLLRPNYLRDVDGHEDPPISDANPGRDEGKACGRARSVSATRCS